MATTVKDRIKTELGQAKEESKNRAERISAILKDAASLTFEELKGGSAELNVLTRRSLAELLEELKEASDQEVVEAEIEQTTFEVESETQGSAKAPSWKELLSHAFVIVRDRKGDWFQQLKDYLKQNAARFDGDMTEEYGDRYARVKSAFKRFVAWYRSAKAQADAANGQTAAQPVNIEVVDDEITDAEAKQLITLLQSEKQTDSLQ